MRRALAGLLACLIAQPALADISFVGGAVGESVGNTDVTVTLPGGLQTNDLLLFTFCIADADNVNLDLVMVSSGWSEIADQFGNGTEDANMASWVKYHNGTDTTVVGEGSTGGTDTAIGGVVMAFRGVALTGDGGPFDVTPTGTSGASGNLDPLSVDWVTEGTWVVIAGCKAGATFTDTDTYTFPSGYTTNAINAAELDTADVNVGMGYNSSPADPENPGVMTPSVGGTGWTALTLPLREAPPPPACTAGLNMTLLGVGGCP
jgi:hypothetical protein